ncbi:coproporphyrinogen III oxidase [Edaphobacter acidisoli]|uniref:Coproporphyrinogen III oxidase n=1 Tax=Edaphobacter acidisoli TaxID=2040573 RepID=A0A916RNB2_9BACT|nr:DUF1223 domain-containing protein [Edaphobacter acidisoli]GGA60556.1 coproporphyrinogen III oxidase [Edaphobacter acidisoli]
MDRQPRLRALTVSAALLVLFSASLRVADAQTSTRTPVLVELFTSEGCSSCPPADTLLAKLSELQPVQTANIIVLSEHVDYWDHQGWRDRFSSASLTDRQRAYGTIFRVPDIYTPQIVVDGASQFVGTDSRHILDAIQHQSQATKLNLVLSKANVDGDRIAASISIATPTDTLKGDLYAALVDPSDTTNVSGGENKGHSLQFVNVVRTFQHIGSLKDLRSGPHSFTIEAPKDSKPAAMRLIVFAQSKDNGPVLGAVTASVTP